MSGKPVIPREQALRDVEAAIDYYVSEAGERVALEFIEALEAAYRAIAEHPSTGSPRYAHELNLPGLRSRALKRYPYLVCYIEHEHHLDIWRVLHAQRDIPAGMQASDDPELL